jgi:hypothetical protein
VGDHEQPVRRSSQGARQVFGRDRLGIDQDEVELLSPLLHERLGDTN